MKNVMKTIGKDLSILVDLDKKMSKLHKPSEMETESLQAQQRFEATFYSNKLEGNKLTKKEAREAILF